MVILPGNSSTRVDFNTTGSARLALRMGGIGEISVPNTFQSNIGQMAGGRKEVSTRSHRFSIVSGLIHPPADIYLAP